MADFISNFALLEVVFTWAGSKFSILIKIVNLSKEQLSSDIDVKVLYSNLLMDTYGIVQTIFLLKNVFCGKLI